MSLNLISSYTIINKVIRDYGLQEDEPTLIEWIGEAIEGIGINKDWCQESVAFINLINYQCQLPNQCKAIIQIAKNTEYNSFEEIDEQINAAETSGEPVPIDEYGQPLSGVDFAYYRPFYDYIWNYQFWYTSALYNQQFIPVRLANQSFYNSIVCLEPGIIYNNESPEYTIIPETKSLRFNFESGQIALSYLRQITDEKGYPMIPDDYSYITAIASYIIYKKSNRDFYTHVIGSDGRLLKAEKDWQFYCRQAKNKSRMPSTVDDYENLVSNNRYKLPTDKYKTFFK